MIWIKQLFCFVVFVIRIKWEHQLMGFCMTLHVNKVNSHDGLHNQHFFRYYQTGEVKGLTSTRFNLLIMPWVNCGQIFVVCFKGFNIRCVLQHGRIWRSYKLYLNLVGLQINDIEPFCQDEIALYKQCAERRVRPLLSHICYRYSFILSSPSSISSILLLQLITSLNDF